MLSPRYASLVAAAHGFYSGHGRSGDDAAFDTIILAQRLPRHAIATAVAVIDSVEAEHKLCTKSTRARCTMA